LPVKQKEKQARNQNIGASLDGFRDNLCPPSLETLTRHHAVLNRKRAEEQEIDDERADQRVRLARIDGLRDKKISGESDGVKKGS